MRVLITGIEGFVAPYLAQPFIGKEEVYGTYFLEPSRISAVRYKYMDVTDAHSVKSIISSIRPDKIFHLAGFSSVAEAWKNPEKVMKINADGTKNILEAVKALGLNPKIVVVSSADVYGKPKEIPIPETHALQPISPYGKSRVMQEKIVENYEKLDITISRSFSHTGPTQLPKFVCPAFAHQIALIEKGLQNPVIRHGDLSVKRDFTDVRDVVKAYKLLSERGKPHEAYNVCSEKAYPISEILDALISMSKVAIRKELDTSKVRPIEIQELIGSNKKLCRDTGWKPAISFNDTLKDILEYWRKTV
ncbi:MAG: GDP-mannose 4,6-dehydratase [Candidatus Woesearchaeota archaeon]